MELGRGVGDVSCWCRDGAYVNMLCFSNIDFVLILSLILELFRNLSSLFCDFCSWDIRVGVVSSEVHLTCPNSLECLPYAITSCAGRPLFLSPLLLHYIFFYYSVYVIYIYSCSRCPTVKCMTNQTEDNIKLSFFYLFRISLLGITVFGLVGPWLNSFMTCRSSSYNSFGAYGS